MDKIENSLGDFFKGLPSLSPKSKNSLANAWPWIALVFGFIQLLAAIFLWHLTRLVNQVNVLISSSTLEHQTIGNGQRAVIYAGIVLLILEAIMLFVAVNPLKLKKRRGWELVFKVVILNVIYSVLTIFINGRGFGSFIFSLLGSGVGFYLLLQVKEKFALIKVK